MTGEQFELIVAGAGAGHAEDLDEASFNLLGEITDVDGVEAAEAVAGPAPAGTRAAAEVVAATIVVTYYAYRTARYTVETLPQLARVIRHWLDRNRDKRAVVRFRDGSEVDVTDLSEVQTREVLERGTAPSADGERAPGAGTVPAEQRSDVG